MAVSDRRDPLSGSRLAFARQQEEGSRPGAKGSAAASQRDSRGDTPDLGALASRKREAGSVQQAAQQPGAKRPRVPDSPPHYAGKPDESERTRDTSPKGQDKQAKPPGSARHDSGQARSPQRFGPSARGGGHESRGRTSYQPTGSREQQREPLWWEVRGDWRESEQALDRLQHFERELEEQRERRKQAEHKLAAANEKAKQLELDLASVSRELTRQQGRSQVLEELLAREQERQRAERARRASPSPTQSTAESDGGGSRVTSDVHAAAEGEYTGDLVPQHGSADEVFRYAESLSCGWLHPTQVYKQPSLILRDNPDRVEDEDFWRRIGELLALNGEPLRGKSELRSESIFGCLVHGLQANHLSSKCACIRRRRARLLELKTQRDAAFRERGRSVTKTGGVKRRDRGGKQRR